MSGLRGKRVALLQERRGSELAALVRRQGGEPVAAAAVREQPVHRGPEVAALIDRLTDGSIGFVVLLTGAGTQALFGEAERLGRRAALLQGLRVARTVCRGPKPAAALAREQITPSLRAPEPYTTAELLRVLGDVELAGAGVAVVHYGERDRVLSETLRVRGADLMELCLYEWLLPEDLSPLQALIGEILAGRLDAIAFTSQVQVRHLVHVARTMGKEAELVAALNTRVTVASLAPTCAAALRGLGVEPDVVPEHSKMGHLVVALARSMSG